MTIAVVRRTIASLAAWGAVCLPLRRSFGASDDDLIFQLFDRRPVESPLVRLQMPPVFGNGYSVPLTLDVDSPMTEDSYVRAVLVLAPQNPIVTVAKFEFTPKSGRAALSTRIRLSKPQTVLAVADMSDGTLLMARSWVKVDTDGCS